MCVYMTNGKKYTFKFSELRVVASQSSTRSLLNQKMLTLQCHYNVELSTSM